MNDFAGLRVVLVGPLPPPAGGMAQQTRQLAQLLGDAGAQVALVQSNAPYRPSWVAAWPLVRAACRLVLYVVALWRAIGRGDVVHVMANSGWSWHLHAVPPIWIGWLRGVAVIVNYRGGEAEGFLRRWSRVVRWSMARVSNLVVPSGFLERVFARHGMATRVVPNIVDRALFQPRGRHGGDAPIVFVARNLEPIYGIDVALRAFALVRVRIPSCRLVVAGTGPEAARLEALAHSLGVAHAVDFVGRLEREQVADQLARCRVALNPSRVDNMPNSVLEALASGVPVVSTNVGGVPYVVEHERSALLVPPDDARAMADAISRVLDEPELAGRLAAAGVAEARRYDWCEVGPCWATVYRGAVAGVAR